MSLQEFGHERQQRLGQPIPVDERCLQLKTQNFTKKKQTKKTRHLFRTKRNGPWALPFVLQLRKQIQTSGSHHPEGKQVLLLRFYLAHAAFPHLCRKHLRYLAAKKLICILNPPSLTVTNCSFRKSHLKSSSVFHLRQSQQCLKSSQDLVLEQQQCFRKTVRPEASQASTHYYNRMIL